MTALSIHRALAASLAVALSVLVGQPTLAADADIIKIAVFEFARTDKSAGGGVIDWDETDLENVTLSAEQARAMLADSGRYNVLDAGSAEGEVSAAGGVLDCDGCEAPLAKQLGAEQSLIGIITRITRTEYTLQILVRDAASGAVLTNAFTGLRMGANYSWPRGVKSLMRDKVLPALDSQ